MHVDARSSAGVSTRRIAVVAVMLVGLCQPVYAQSGKGGGTARRTITLNVIVNAPDERIVTKEDFDLYDDGLPQEIETLSRIDSGSKIVLMIDSSTSLKVETPALQKTVQAVINELYEDDQMMVVGYNETAEIIEDLTTELEKLNATPAKIIRKGFPNLFDALIAVSDALAHHGKTGAEKRAIILISDGYDSESKTKFVEALYALQDENIVLYAIQAPDRTRGALLRDKPKPPAALEQLTTATGGAVFQLSDAEEAAVIISEDLRRRWYRLTYSPAGINPINTRRLLLMPRVDRLAVRTKGSHPGRYRPQY